MAKSANFWTNGPFYFIFPPTISAGPNEDIDTGLLWYGQFDWLMKTSASIGMPFQVGYSVLTMWFDNSTSASGARHRFCRRKKEGPVAGERWRILSSYTRPVMLSNKLQSATPWGCVSYSPPLLSPPSRLILDELSFSREQQEQEGRTHGSLISRCTSHLSWKTARSSRGELETQTLQTRTVTGGPLSPASPLTCTTRSSAWTCPPTSPSSGWRGRQSRVRRSLWSSARIGPRTFVKMSPKRNARWEQQWAQACPLKKSGWPMIWLFSRFIWLSDVISWLC